ncbi:hypothetical protein HG530_013952 [Fusarium avenaceum]|nr:hypothetical protein HG530_013952 [Fusarium avenaceum]
MANPKVVVHDVDRLTIDLFAASIKRADATQTTLDVASALIVALAESDLVAAGVTVKILLAAVGGNLVLGAWPPAVQGRKSPVVRVLAGPIRAAVLVRRDVGVTVRTHVCLGVLIEDEAVGREVSVRWDGPGQALGDHARVVFFAAVTIIDCLEVVGCRRVPRANLLVRDRLHGVFETLGSANRGPRICLCEGLGVVEHDGIVIKGHVDVSPRVNCELVQAILLDTIRQDTDVLVAVRTLVFVIVTFGGDADSYLMGRRTGFETSLVSAEGDKPFPGVGVVEVDDSLPRTGRTQSTGEATIIVLQTVSDLS